MDCLWVPLMRIFIDPQWAPGPSKMKYYKQTTMVDHLSSSEILNIAREGLEGCHVRVTSEVRPRRSCEEVDKGGGWVRPILPRNMLKAVMSQIINEMQWFYLIILSAPQTRQTTQGARKHDFICSNRQKPQYKTRSRWGVTFPRSP